MGTAPGGTRGGDASRAAGAVLLALDRWAWAALAGKPCFAWALAGLRGVDLCQMVAAVSSHRAPLADALLDAADLPSGRRVLPLRRRRPRDLREALAGCLDALDPDVEIVLLCDMTSPLLQPTTARAVLDAVTPGVIALAAEAVKDTVKVVRGGHVAGTIPRERLAIAHAPLAATRADLVRLLANAHHYPRTGTEEGRATALSPLALIGIASQVGLALVSVPAHGESLRVASREDAAVAAGLLRAYSEAPLG